MNKKLLTVLCVFAMLAVAVSAGAQVKNAFGVTLPNDAAPLNQQFLRLLTTDGTTVDFAVSVYKRVHAYCNILCTPLVRLNKNFEISPYGATSYEASKDGKTWTFHLDKNLKWSDGNPVTADDIVFTMQYEADPKHAWDFAWFWGDLVNWDNAVAGKVPTTELGVKKVDTYTVQFMTTVPSPYFPSKALYVRPLSKVAFDKYGEYYNNDPKTSVSSSPWVLQEWTMGKKITFGPNKNYTGKLKPYLEYLTFDIASSSAAGGSVNIFNAYRNGEVDWCETFSTADMATISKDAQLNKEYHPSFGDFRTYYLGFNTYDKPFNDLRVRQAISKAVDRETIVKKVAGRQGMAAYSFLMPGFPCATSELLKKEDVNKYDVKAAQKLLADAGYPGGKGFPKMELWLRNEGTMNQAIASAIGAQLQENLGISVEVSNKEAKVFMDSLNAHTLPFYFLSYGFDYLDPSNMLGIWTTGGRHAWTNAKFDQLVNEATSLSGDQAKRDQEFKDAEKILVNDVGGAFIYHVTPGYIYKPYMKGKELEADKSGFATWHWPGIEDIGSLLDSIYISNDAPKSRVR